MLKYTRRLGAPFVLASVVLISACSSDAKKGPDSTALGADTTLNKDLALAGRDTTAQPQLKDVPPTPAAKEPSRPVTRPPARKTPATPTAPPASTPKAPPTTTTANGNTVTTTPAGTGAAAGGGAVGSIPSGSTLNTHASSKICTNTNAVGDHVTASVDNSVSGSNGAMIPAGATLNLTVTHLKRSENSNDPVVLEFAVNSVTFGGHTYPVDASVTSANVTRVRDQPQSKDIQKVGIGAVAGAIAGKILGKSTKGAVIGGAAGAAAGAAAAAATANYQGCIDAGSSIVVTLTSPATVKV
ncbi:MAG TPA: hypothetical protein VK636_22400 [Gemmatimonadaceae bacterium]|nr:hypothetical protein [Gemmatimonadaceae bacterium]